MIMFGNSIRGCLRAHCEGNAARLRRALAMLCLLAACVAVPDVLRAQALPDAGRMLQDVTPATVAPPAKSSRGALPREEARPAMSAAGSRRIMVRHWRIVGAHAFPVSKLQALVSDYRGEDLTLAGLEKVAGVVTEYYRRHGYLLSRAYIPAQTVENDTVEIAVIEGHLSDIHVTNHSVVAVRVIKDHLERLLSLGPVEGPGLERSLMLLSDLPGIDVQSTLRPGPSMGTSELDVDIRDTARLSGSVDANNFGNRYTGQFQGGGTLYVNELLHLGDLFTLRGDTSGPGMKYGRAGWQVPLGGSGLQAGAAGSYLRYQLGNKFASLDASGSAQVGTLWASYPLLRGVYRDLAVQVSFDAKQLDDRIGAVGSDSRRNLDVITLGLSGDETDGFGGGESAPTAWA
jgi:hemolysin activation/secretion protein